MCAQQRLRSAWANAQADQSLHCAQADLSLRWAHAHFVGFVLAWLNYGSDCPHENALAMPGN